ncbi:PilZ domain-containing protein [Leptospira langatensis]|uniref:PilZ domain-containing protein n=1 Tax=Leptospira langatensis TaxID=2484983 RepID=A0A5F1ZVB3_9LEPT|nr:PilZ domain-containing protein [Leptospira langatensis]TGJ99997.1 PilZ domain-containing protein [Leptospira langatensis]TGL42634.1 PilZ domain-containing protein [Leptospira langatensis]
MSDFDHKPRSPRFYPRDFNEYIVQVDSGLITLEGKLGNISESGICVLMSGEDLANSIVVEGSVIERKTGKRLEFLGDVVWKIPKKIESKQRFLYGIRFRNPLELTESLILINLSLEG